MNESQQSVKKAGRKERGNEKFVCGTRFESLLKEEVARRKKVNGHGTLYELYEEIAEYCGIGTGMVNRLKRGLVLPSIPVGVKIADYFDLALTDVWPVTENSDYFDDRERCSLPSCNHLVLSKGLCFRHYNIEKSKTHNERKKDGHSSGL